MDPRDFAAADHIAGLHRTADMLRWERRADTGHAGVLGGFRVALGRRLVSLGTSLLDAGGGRVPTTR